MPPATSRTGASTAPPSGPSPAAGAGRATVPSPRTTRTPRRWPSRLLGAPSSRPEGPSPISCSTPPPLRPTSTRRTPRRSMPPCACRRPAAPGTRARRSAPRSAPSVSRWNDRARPWSRRPTSGPASPAVPTRPPAVTPPPRWSWATARSSPSTSVARRSRRSSSTGGVRPASPGPARGRSASARAATSPPGSRPGPALDLAAPGAGGVDRVVVAGTHARACAAMAKALADVAPVADDLAATVGNPGAAQPALLLTAALEAAAPG